jgi:hypothetical protein
MGGRGNSLDTPANLILVCARYNLEMESDSKIMVSALVRGHKLRQTDSFFEPIFDNVTNQWFILDNEGRKNATNSRSPQF